MQPKKSDRQRSFFCPDLLDQFDPRNHLFGLSRVIPWQVFEGNFRPHYAASRRPGKPVRLMVGLLILTRLENLSDECVVEAWVQDPYFQAFCIQQRFTWKFPCDPSVLTYFPRRIGEDGVLKIFEISVALPGDKAKEAEVVVDFTVQEKNITFPMDAKFLTKIVTRCRTMAKLEDVKLRRSYQRAIKPLLRTIRFKSKGCRQGESQRAVRRLRTITGILVRELKRKLSPDALPIHQKALDLCDREQRQQRSDTGKIYSHHEPGVSCISKGKTHKKYEFGAKASVTVTKTSGIIVGALSFRDNPFDGHTLPSVLSQVESIGGQRPTMAICDRGYRGKRRVGLTRIEIRESGADEDRIWQASSQRVVPSACCLIGPLKNDHRMLCNNLKG